MPKLIKQWKSAYKLSSMQLLAIDAAIETINGAIDDVFPRWISVGLILASMGARLILQEKIK